MSKLIEVLEFDVKKRAHRFGSDYYIRQACLPSGAKRSEVEETEDSNTEEKSIPQEEEINEPNGVEPIKFSDEPIVNDSSLVTATPIFIDEPINVIHNTNSLEYSLEEIYPDNNFSSEITSDSDVSLVNCYNVTESVVYKKLSGENEEIQTAEKIFDFESIEVLNLDETLKQNEDLKPIAKPRTKVNSAQIADKNPLDIQLDEMMITNDKIEDNFDTTPYIISKRSDNTLIKKIYSDPSVRLFALKNRNTLPLSNNNNINVHNVFNDLVKKPTINTITKIKDQNNIQKTEATSDDQISETELLISTPTKENQQTTEEIEQECKNFLYGIVLAQQCNNLRSDYKGSTEIIQLKEQKLVANRLREISKSSVNLSEISDETLNKEFKSGFCKEKQHTLPFEGEGLSKEGRSTSVKDLRKKFELFDAKAKEKPILYSLTGRSISKQFKERLRDLNENSPPSLSQVHSLSLTNLEVEENSR